MGQKAIFSSHGFDQNNSQEAFWHNQICQHSILSPLQESVLWICRLRVWEEPAETTNGSIIWLIKLAKISQDVQRAIVPVNLFHDLVSSLTQAAWPVFTSTMKGFFLPWKSHLAVTMVSAALWGQRKGWRHTKTSGLRLQQMSTFFFSP